MNDVPQRIVCLSAEAADWLWRIGAWERVVGVTAYFVPPPGAAARPRVGGFSLANLNQITELRPDLVITFSDVQAKLTTELMRNGLNVLATNQRTLAETEAVLALLSRVVGCERGGELPLREFRERLGPTSRPASPPRVYFEEWNDPLISGIAWVGELIERAGGEDIFPELRTKRSAPERVVSPEQVLHANPDILLASWCGKAVNTATIASRPGWQDLAAVRQGRMWEIASADILQPGWRLLHGYERLKRIIRSASGGES